MADELWKGAQRDLMVKVEGAPVDPCVWDHAARVARIAEALLAIPELRENVVDAQALLVAALYHDAGWVLQVRAGECHARDILLKPSTDLQREMAADWMAERVAGQVGPGIIHLAARIIRQINNRRTDLVEARILADAENLDEIGVHGISLMIRKICAEGRTLGDIISLWQRQQEYNYWPARIRDGFHFETTRRLAKARLAKLSRFMDDLREVVQLEDLLGLQASGSKAPRWRALRKNPSLAGTVQPPVRGPPDRLQPGLTGSPDRSRTHNKTINLLTDSLLDGGVPTIQYFRGPDSRFSRFQSVWRLQSWCIAKSRSPRRSAFWHSVSHA
jgi:HD superfamily phosphodiesterase